MKKLIFFLIFILVTLFESNAQVTGATPYISQFGSNQVDSGSGANWKVINLDANNIVIAIVDVYGDVVAHAFIKKKESYMFKDLPIGSYSYKFSSAGSFFESKKLVNFQGCNPKIYICEGGPEWEVQVWVKRSTNSSGKSGKISKKAFFGK